MTDHTDDFPAIERERLIQVLRRHRPKYAWIFGSRASRTAVPGSDVDLLIVDEQVGGASGIEVEISIDLMPRSYHLDILAYTPQGLEQRTGGTDSFLREILEQAELLYERG